jgi:hypothetical protein
LAFALLSKSLGNLSQTLKEAFMKKTLAVCFFIACSGQAAEMPFTESNRDFFQGIYSQGISAKYSGTQLMKTADGKPVLCDSSSGPYDCVDVSVNEMSIQKIDDYQDTYYVKILNTGLADRTCRLKVEMKSNHKNSLIFRATDSQCTMVLTKSKGSQIQIRQSGCDQHICPLGVSLTGLYAINGDQEPFQKSSTSISILRSEEF